MAGLIKYLVITMMTITTLHWADAIRIRDAETEKQRLIWAPLNSLKSPFTTFINDFNYPSWSTRHQMTKRTSHRHLHLAKEVPFAVVCGACYGPSSLKPNLTLSISDHTFESVAKTRIDRSFQYSVGVNECIMTYLITEPIQKDGTITCILYRGKQVVHEKITFEAVQVEILEPAEAFEIQTTENPIELNCPSTEEGGSPMKNDPENPTMNVWYEDTKPSSSSSSSSQKTIRSPIPSTKKTIYIEQPKYTTTIVCSVYNIFRPGVVHQRRYKIQGQRTNVKSEYQVSEYDEDAENLPPRVNLSSSILAIVILAAIVCVLIGFIGIYRFCAAARS